MRAESDLRKLRADAERRLRRLRVGATTAISAPEPEREALVTHCVVELYNCWHAFSRSLFLSSAFRARDGNGQRVRVTALSGSSSIDDALGIAIRRNKPALYKRKKPPWTWQDEPAWASPQVLLASLDELGASNRPVVSSGISGHTNFFDGVTRARHFYAHRNKDTIARVRPVFRSAGIGPKVRPSVALLSTAVSRGAPRPQVLLLDWIDDAFNAVSSSV